jgi:hypothetical protein
MGFDNLMLVFPSSREKNRILELKESFILSQKETGHVV